MPDLCLAVLLLIPLLTMLPASLRYWQEFKREKRAGNRGYNADYPPPYFALAVGVLGMWLSWLSAIFCLAAGKTYLFANVLSLSALNSPLFFLPGCLLFLAGATTYNLTLLAAGKYLRPSNSGTLASQQLVDCGPFAVVRHPLYLSYLLIAFGLGGIMHSLLPLGSALLLALGLYPSAQAEERVLEQQLGESYRTYQRRVGMLFPRRRS